jgi:hypothetical protein
MGVKLSLVTAALGALIFTVAFGCDSKKFASADNYAACAEGVIVDFSDNQKVVCDDLKAGVEDLCGFDLTVEPCTCAAQLTACTGDTAWLQTILDCRSGSSTCVAYMTCLEGVGASPSGCTDPTTWECIVPSTDAGDQ